MAVYEANNTAWSSGTTHTFPITTSPAQKGKCTTETVQIMAGWVGLVRVDGRIVWQSSPHRKRSRASKAADKRLRDRLAKLLGD